MNNFKNFAPYTPGEDKRELVDAGVLFLLDENGNDWYECQKLFSECTKVIAYDSNNIVVSITDDASTLWPIGLSVAEVDSLPEDVDINGGWVFRDNSVVKRIYSDTELQQQAESKKAALLSHAESVIVTLERAVKLNMATDEERAKLEAWERYSVLVYRVDTAKPEWYQKNRSEVKARFIGPSLLTWLSRPDDRIETGFICYCVEI